MSPGAVTEDCIEKFDPSTLNGTDVIFQNEAPDHQEEISKQKFPLIRQLLEAIKVSWWKLKVLSASGVFKESLAIFCAFHQGEGEKAVPFYLELVGGFLQNY